MCGRLNVIDDPLCIWVQDVLGLKFSTHSNSDLRPTQPLAAIHKALGQLAQLDCSWGIKPQWAKQLLINAQAETVREKKTFAKAFREHRVLVPCSGWYEWRTEAGTKHKYAFSHPAGEPLLMAGIYYPSYYEQTAPQLVPLTTAPTQQCAEYHNRMPLLVPLDAVGYWFNSVSENLDVLLHSPSLPFLINRS
ncbi:SOS response-associated peptidase [Shewanella sp. 3B26]|uniref:Abasic site processing protein n=1 Tax=Shewanella zhuhaiensis TaxID=2919576 RepID=A0AAJ1BJ06_9GAMM|nr:SOS response-associated peptidase family protein [Shewanella zhuhaiensis]MCH4295576.1 SOS response-associated peptidase [Shewanella zhuhaiensis]